jgi:hypothetical protein
VAELLVYLHAEYLQDGLLTHLAALALDARRVEQTDAAVTARGDQLATHLVDVVTHGHVEKNKNALKKPKRVNITK